MTEFMTSKALYFGFVKLLILSFAFVLKLIIISFEMPTTISISSISSSFTSTSSFEIWGKNKGRSF